MKENLNGKKSKLRKPPKSLTGVIISLSIVLLGLVYGMYFLIKPSFSKKKKRYMGNISKKVETSARRNIYAQKITKKVKKVLTSPAGFKVTGTIEKKPEIQQLLEKSKNLEIKNKQAKEFQNIVLYFSEEGATGLNPEHRKIEKCDNTLLLAKRIIEELEKGPRDSSNVSVIPKNMKLRVLFFNAGVIYVDYMKGIKGLGSAAESLAIYAVVNSLTSLPQIDKVKFLINGKEEKTLAKDAGHIDIDRYFTENESILGSD